MTITTCIRVKLALKLQIVCHKCLFRLFQEEKDDQHLNAQSGFDTSY